MRRTIGILAHVDAGKTTLSEQVLYHAGLLKQAGRVDQKNAFFDCHTLERQRGITIFSDQAYFDTDFGRVYWLDTPGHVDFSTEMERALHAVDAAVLVISLIEGIQSHTETAWQLLARNHIPVFLFLNKSDREGADVERLLATLRARFSPDICQLNDIAEDGTLPPATVEWLAERDESLMTAYFSEGYTPRRWMETLRRMTHERRVFPCFSGSALQDIGVESFLQAMLQILPWPDPADAPDFSALVYKVRYDARGNRLCYMKCLSGTLSAREKVQGPNADEAEKVNELRLCQGEKFQTVPQVARGDLFAASGLMQVRAGDLVGVHPGRLSNAIQPMLTAMVIVQDPSISSQALLHAFRIVEDEDPALSIHWDEALNMLTVYVMGDIQLEILSAVMASRFHIPVTFSDCRIRYLETLAAPVVGIGHYEPLRHYAEVQLHLYPAPAGQGITFESRCHVDELPLRYQHLIETHVFEKVHKGVQIGAPLTDVHIVLVAARFHLKHTEGGDFRESTYRAIRHALMCGRTTILEPVCSFELRAPVESMGKLMMALSRILADTEAPFVGSDTFAVKGTAPAETLLPFAKALPASTRGRGVLSYRLDHYAPCHNADEVVASINYHPEWDYENTADSIFCAHGAGVQVNWRDVAATAHIPLIPLDPS